MTDLPTNSLELEQSTTCEGQNHDPSIEELKILCDPLQPEGARRAAFASMLHRESGWWGKGSLRRHTATTARLSARNALGGYNVSIDVLDWEAVADDSLLILYNGGHRIMQSPRNWLHGVIRNLVLTESRQILQHLQARPEMLSAEPASDEESESFDPVRSTALRSAIGDLPRALRQFALLHFLQGLSRKETQAALATTAANIRVCHKRALERLRAALDQRPRKPADVRSPPRSSMFASPIAARAQRRRSRGAGVRHQSVSPVRSTNTGPIIHHHSSVATHCSSTFTARCEDRRALARITPRRLPRDAVLSRPTRWMPEKLLSLLFDLYQGRCVLLWLADWPKRQSLLLPAICDVHSGPSPLGAKHSGHNAADMSVTLFGPTRIEDTGPRWRLLDDRYLNREWHDEITTPADHVDWWCESFETRCRIPFHVSHVSLPGDDVRVRAGELLLVSPCSSTEMAARSRIGGAVSTFQQMPSSPDRSALRHGVNASMRQRIERDAAIFRSLSYIVPSTEGNRLIRV